MLKRILVFPCGSEIGLEIHRSIHYSTHFQLVGASSVDDHGRFVFEEYVDGLPHHLHPDFADRLAKVVQEYRIDAIYPAMDAVAETVKNLETKLGIVVIGSSPSVTCVCASKASTYENLRDVVPTPEYFHKLEHVKNFPVFIKPDRGYGSRNTHYASDVESARSFLAKFDPGSMLLLEYLPGQEWTIDCFTDRHGTLRFHAGRSRSRISNGISVHTIPSDAFQQDFENWANSINQKLHPRGAWFFQAKLDRNNKPKLLEVAARLGGSSSLFRCQGVNFALLSAFDAFNMDVSINRNNYIIELDRALDNRYKIDIEFQSIFVDLDDCLIVRGKINYLLVSFLYKAISEGKEIVLITRHHRDPLITLREHRISQLFDRIIHITSTNEKKSVHIDKVNAIFIDDSYAERIDVARLHNIPVFSPDMVEALL